MNASSPKRSIGSAIRALFVAAWVGLTPASAHEARLLSLTNLHEFTYTSAPKSDAVVLTSPELNPGFPWTELIVSWNATSNVTLTIEARPIPPGSSFYSFGHWAARTGPDSRRESINGQRDALAELKTDTLVLQQPAQRVQVRIAVRGPVPELKRIALAFTGPGGSRSAAPFRQAWGRELRVPVRTQAEYPEGVDKWCSPTSTAMLLAYWSEQKARPDWMISVPDTAQAVFDPGWGGTGNWPFNMAFVGSLPGLNGAVARFGSVVDLEHWVAAGLPAAVSVSYNLLKGMKEPTSGDGHLVVVRGFTADGDVIVNDPGVRRERVRRVFSRADFETAWAHSGRTVYCVWPDGYPLPEGAVFPR